MEKRVQEARSGEIPPAVFIGAIAATVAVLGWVLWANTGLSGAQNPIGSAGNVDPYNSGKAPKMKQSQPPNATRPNPMAPVGKPPEGAPR
jgi:hypothetical protein